MKRQILLISLFYVMAWFLSWGDEMNFDKIILTPFIESNAVQNGAADKLLTQKLNQAVIKSGLAGQGINDRFIITAHANELELVPTATAPVKYALRIMLTIYVGDGVDGLLFSSYAMELKGIGKTVDDAYLSAYRKLRVNDPELLSSIEAGRQGIIDYYNEHAASIISRARALADARDYDQAVYQLFQIPPFCANYDEAQNLAGEIASQAIEERNEQVLSNARAAWASSPNEAGASQAQSILSQISNPSSAIVAKVEQFTTQMAKRIEHVEDEMIKHEQQKEKNRHTEKMTQIRANERTEQARIRSNERTAKARINANERTERARINANSRVNVAQIHAARDVAVAYYRSRPKTVYHVHWW